MLPKIVMLGKPGSGKGTQAANLSALLHIPHISTGDMLRAAMAQHTPLGEKIRARMDAASLVSNQEVNEVLIDRLAQPDCDRGWILDGYPRRIEQAVTLDRLARPTLVILLEVTDEVAESRMANRRVCANGHVSTKLWDGLECPPCQQCGAPLAERTEDSTVAKRHKRLSEYHQHTEPVVRYYEAQNKLLTVAGSMQIEAIERFLLAQPAITRFVDDLLG